jgi:hypothetical protein
MLRANSLDRLQEKRTLRGVYIWHQATPYACFLDTASVRGNSSCPIQAMVASKTTGEQMRSMLLHQLFRSACLPTSFNGAMDELGGGTEIGVSVVARRNL